MFKLFLVAYLLASLSLPLTRFVPVMVRHRASCSTLPTFQWFQSVLHPSPYAQPIPQNVCTFLFCTSGTGSIQQMSHHPAVECKESIVSRIQLLQFLQCCCRAAAISVLNSFLYTNYRVSVCFVRGPAPNAIRQRIRVELSLWVLIFHLNSQFHIYGTQGLSNLTSFHHCVELGFSHAQCNQALKCGSRFHRIVPNLAAPGVLFHETWSPAKSLCDFVNFFLSSTLYCSFWVSRYRAARFAGRKSNSLVRTVENKEEFNKNLRQMKRADPQRVKRAQATAG